MKSKNHLKESLCRMLRKEINNNINRLKTTSNIFIWLYLFTRIRKLRKEIRNIRKY